MAINKTARPTYKLLPYYLLALLNKLCDKPTWKFTKCFQFHVGFDQVDLSSTNTTTEIFLPKHHLNQW